MKIQQIKILVVTAGNCSECNEPLNRKNEGRAISIVTQKRRRYIGQRFCIKHLPSERQLRILMKAVPSAIRKTRIQKAREEAQAKGMREADLLDYCNRCGNKGSKCRCPGGPYFP